MTRRSHSCLLAILVLLPAAAHAQEKPVVGSDSQGPEAAQIRRQTGGLGRCLRHAGPCRPPRLRQPGRPVLLPLGRRQPLHRPEVPRPEAGPRRPATRNSGTAMPWSSTWTPGGATSSVPPRSAPAACTCSGPRSRRPRSSPGSPSETLPAFKDFKLQGAEVAAEKTPWGWTAEFKLPWKNFPDFKAKAGEIIGIECELCSSDGG